MRMKDVDVEFAEMLSARFCHDMAGPIGAVSNGIDFLHAEDLEIRSRAAELIMMSSRQGIGRLTFIRQAYGYMSLGSEVSIANIISLITNFMDGTRITFEIMPHDATITFDGKLAKLILNLVLIAAHAIMFNGSMKIDLQNKIEIIATAKSYKLDEGLELVLMEDYKNVEMTTRNVQSFYARFIADDINYSIKFAQNMGNVVFSVEKK